MGALRGTAGRSDQIMFAAYLVYGPHPLTQKQAAKRMRVSEGTVNAWLKEAKERRWVRHVLTPSEHHVLSLKLEERFSEVTFHVVRRPDASIAALDVVADYAADLVGSAINRARGEVRLGLAAGRTIAGIVSRLLPVEAPGRVSVYAMDAIVVPTIALSSAGLVAQAAAALGIPFESAYAVPTPDQTGQWAGEAWNAVAHLARDTDISVIGLGSFDAEVSSLREMLECQGVTIAPESVADIRYVFLARDGTCIQEVEFARVVSASDLSNRLREKPQDTTVILVAAGRLKALALLAALRYNSDEDGKQRCFNHVVVDTDLASEVLSLLDAPIGV